MIKSVATSILLFFGLAVSAQTTNMTTVPAQTNSTGIDWRYGRPGVFVLTNAEPAVTSVLSQRTITINGVSGTLDTNLSFSVSGDGGPVEGGVSAAEATNIARSVSSESTQGLVSAEASAQGATNAALWAAGNVRYVDVAGLASNAVAATLAVNAVYASTAGTASNAAVLTGSQSNEIAQAAVHTNRTDNPHAVTAEQVGALTASDTNGWTVSQHQAWITNEVDTLAIVAARGNFAGTEDIGPLRVNARMFGTGAGDGATGNDWFASGQYAGQSAIGDSWCALGPSAGREAVGGGWVAVGSDAGYKASGSFWMAYGNTAGYMASGDEWAAIGLDTAYRSAVTNVFSAGRYAGYNARGSNRVHVDVYERSPLYAVGGSTNDMIYGDNGYLYLGRGAGAPNGSQGGTLRGVWNVGSLTNVTIHNGNVDGDHLIGAVAVTNVANAAVNGHVAAAEPHAGKYALQTGGAMTNVTLAGNVTLGGVTRATWPSGSTQDIYTPITNLPIVVSGATNVVTITADKRIYLITATNTFNAMTNVFNGVTIGGSNVAWELWVDFTNPNGTNMTWCPCMTFDLGVPEISVTGIYKFACSTIDGIKANVRQVYPTVWPWTWTIFGSKNNNLGASPSLFIEASNTDSTNNYNIATQPADVYNYVRCRYWYYTYDATAATNPTIWLAGYSYEQQPPTLTVIATNKAIQANGGQLDWVLPPATANGRVPWLWLYHRKPYFQGRWSATGMQQRRANELEINAWKSGWRP